MDAGRVARIVAEAPGIRRVGSGYLVRSGVVLTAAHVLKDTPASGVTVDLDVGGPGAHCEPALRVWIDDASDLGIINIAPDPRIGSVGFGRIPRDRDVVVDYAAVGFPWWKRRENERELIRDSVRITGTISSLSNLREGTLELVLAHGPDRDDDPRRSAWEGMSGAAVFVNDRVIGVVAEHHKPEGALHLSVRTLNAAWESLASDRRNELGQLLGLSASLDDVAAVTGARYMASGMLARDLTPLPDPGFVSRQDVVGGVKAWLLAEERPELLRACLLHGLPGSGKTSIAIALANDADIRDRFWGGVVWVTLGQHPDLLGLLLGLFERPPDGATPTNLDGASRALGKAIGDQRILIVLDDLWDTEHAKPLLIGGAQCRTLVTSRRAHLADALKAQLIEIPPMTEEQALTLLERRVGRALADPERADAVSAARAVGFLPKALELAAARNRKIPGWQRLIEALGPEVARLEALEPARSHMRGESSLKALINLSLRWLRAEDESAYRAFVNLGILMEDAEITSRAAATLLHRPDSDAEVLLEWLRDDALLSSVAPVLSGDDEIPVYRMHDVLRHVARGLLIAPRDAADDALPGEGVTLVDAHRRLLERYRARLDRGHWYTLPADGYIHQHLAYHLDRAGKAELLHDVLAEPTPDGHNGWYETRERLRHTAGYMSDLARAERLLTDPEAPRVIALACRYALIRSSLAAVAGSIPGELAARLVETGVWSPLQSIAYVQSISPRHFQNDVLKLLAAKLPGKVALRALGEPESSWDWVWAERAGWLAARLDPTTKNRVLERVTNVLLEDERLYETMADKVLRSIAPELSPTLIERIFDRALQMRSGAHERTRILQTMAPHLPKQVVERAVPTGTDADPELVARLAELGELHRAIQVLQGLTHPPQIARGLVLTAPYLDAAHLREFFVMADKLEDEGNRTRALLALARRSGEFEPRTAVQRAGRALARTSEFQRRNWWLETVKAVGRFAPPQELTNLVDGVLEAADWKQADAFRELAPRLSKQLVLRCLDKIDQRKKSTTFRPGEASAVLLARLTELESAGQVLRRVMSISEPNARATAMAAIAPGLGAPELSAALNQAAELVDARARAVAVAGLAPYLTADGARVALRIVRGVRDRDAQIESVTELATYGREDRFGEVLAAVAADKDAERRARGLERLFLRVPLSSQPRALDLAWQLACDGNDAVLTALLPELAEELWQDLINRAFALPEAALRAGITEALAAHVPLSASIDFERRVRAEIEPQRQSAVLLALALHLADAGEAARSVAFAEELAHGPEKDPYYAADVLAALTPGLDGEPLAVAARICRHLFERGPECALSETCAVAKDLASAGLLEPALALLKLVSSRVDLLLAPRSDGTRRLSSPQLQTWPAALETVARAAPDLRPSVRELALGSLEWSADAELLARLKPYVEPPFPSELIDAALGERDSILPELSLEQAMPWLTTLVEPARCEAIVRTEFAKLASAIRSPDKGEFSSIYSYLSRLEQLVPLLPGDLLRQLLAEAEHGGRIMDVLPAILRQARVVLDPEVALESFRKLSRGNAVLLTELAPNVPENLLGESFRTALQLRQDRREAIRALAPRIAMLPPGELASLLRALFEAGAHRARAEFLSDLAASGAALHALGGAELVSAVMDGIQDVGNWWP